MRFKKFYQLLNERFNNWTYFVPKDKEHRLFDFYATSLVFPDSLSDINMKIAFKEAQEKIVNQLVEDFKFALYFALASEFRHIGGVEPADPDERAAIAPSARRFFDKIGQKEFYSKYVALLRKTDWERGDSFRALKKINMAPNTMAKIFEDAMNAQFFNRFMGAGYGGHAWGMVAQAWGKLYNVKKHSDKMVLVDHIYDLQHNNDTVFDKVRSYYKHDSLRWLKKALDFKRDIKDPFALYDRISPGLQDPFAYVMKMQNGITLQAFREETGSQPPTKIEPGMFVKLKRVKKGEQYENYRVTKAQEKFSNKIVEIVSLDEDDGWFTIFEDKGKFPWHGDMIKQAIPSPKWTPKMFVERFKHIVKYVDDIMLGDFVLYIKSKTGLDLKTAESVMWKLLKKVPGTKRVIEDSRMTAADMIDGEDYNSGDFVFIRRDLKVGKKMGVRHIQKALTKQDLQLFKSKKYVLTIRETSNDGALFKTKESKTWFVTEIAEFIISKPERDQRVAVRVFEESFYASIN